MQAKRTISFVVILLCIQQVILAQTLKNKIQKSLVEIGETFPSIPTDRLLHLDQVAFSIFKNLNDTTKIKVLLIDNDQEIGQLAMLWLKTGMLYYGHSTLLDIQSAGASTEPYSPLPLSSLREYGFNIKSVRGEKNPPHKITYGSGSWIIYPKSLVDLKTNNDDVFKVYVEKIPGNHTGKNKVELIFEHTADIPREMLYITTRLNNLIQTK